MAGIVQAIDALVARTPGELDDVAWIGAKLAGAAAQRVKRRAVARSTAVRVVAVLAGFGVALLPRWLRWLPTALLIIPGQADELLFVLVVLVLVLVRPGLRRQLCASLRLAVGVRYLSAAAERIGA